MLKEQCLLIHYGSTHLPEYVTVIASGMFLWACLQIQSQRPPSSVSDVE